MLYSDPKHNENQAGNNQTLIFDPIVGIQKRPPQNSAVLAEAILTYSDMESIDLESWHMKVRSISVDDLKDGYRGFIGTIEVGMQEHYLKMLLWICTKFVNKMVDVNDLWNGISEIGGTASSIKMQLEQLARDLLKKSDSDKSSFGTSVKKLIIVLIDNL